MTTPTTIVELRSTLLQVPWRGDAPAAGILSAPKRDIYVLEIETQGGLVGMSYLMPLRGGLQTIDACMKELIAPHIIGRDATEVEAIWQVLYKSNFWLGRMGVTVFALGYRRQARRPAAVPTVGRGAHRDPRLRLGLLPRARPRRHDRARQGIHRPRPQGHQDAGGAHPAVARGRAQRQGDARRPGRRRRDHDRRQHGLGRRHRHPGRPSHRRVRSLLAGGTGDRRGFFRLPTRRDRTPDACGGRREPLHAQRPQALLRDSGRADPAARSDARRLYRAAQDRRRCRTVGHQCRPASFPRDHGPCAGLDPQRQLPRIHGLERRPVDRAGSAVQGRHDDAAGAAGPRARLPAGDIRAASCWPTRRLARSRLPIRSITAP